MADLINGIVHVIEGEVLAHQDEISGCQGVELDIGRVQERVEVAAGNSNVMRFPVLWPHSEQIWTAHPSRLQSSPQN